MIAAAGSTNAGSLIEYTGIGAAQARDWKYSYGQVRFRWDQLFLQGFGNFSNAGESYLLRTGAPIVDESKVSASRGSTDSISAARSRCSTASTTPTRLPTPKARSTGGTRTTTTSREFGAYVHSTTRFSPKLDLVLALR